MRWLRSLLGSAVSGRSGVLVIEGEAGVGKSTLLDSAARAAGELRLVRAFGVPAERDVPHAGLHALLGPLLSPEVLAELPQVQQTALRTSLGMEVGTPSGRLALGSAVLSVLAASGPLCLLVDDLQWLDRSSSDALLFAARRLHAEPVALLATVRLPQPGSNRDAEADTTGLPVMRLDGLPDPAAARTLLPLVHPRVVDTLFAATGGNPLAMVEIAAELTPEEAAGAVPLPNQLPIAQSEQIFSQRLATLPAQGRLAARVVALAGSAPTDVLRDALRHGGLTLADVDGVVGLGLCRVDALAIWRHPLARAAAARGGTTQGRQIHRWLAEAHRSWGGAAFAWHLAESVDATDHEASQALQEVARAAEQSGASADAADAWQRAAALEPAPELRIRLVESAATAALRAGATRRAADLIDAALLQQPGPEAAASLLWRRGRVQHTLGSPRRALEFFLQAADLGQDPDLRVWAPAEALYSAMYAGALD
ncbi:MAG: ATP-binding protein, partial [Nocardioides sp.]